MSILFFIRKNKSFGLTVFIMLMSALFACGQKKNKSDIAVPMDASHWIVPANGQVEFLTYKNTPALRIQPNATPGMPAVQAVIKDVDFTDGTIEFDAEPVDANRYPFLMIKFRQESAKESECFYLRVGGGDGQRRIDAVQYAPYVGGVNLWDLFHYYQGAAPINKTDWNHVRLVVSGLQLKAYVNNNEWPVLEIPRLEGNSKHGSIAFEGYVTFANVVVRPGVTDNLPAIAGADLTNHDPNYIRNWKITEPRELKEGLEPSAEILPNNETKWSDITAERRGLINVTRAYGMSETRRYVWLKTNIKSEKDQRVNVQLGFSDEVWVAVNGRLQYVDKNLYSMPVRKTPDGRIGIENGSFPIALKTGDNEILVCLANNFFGWGLIARLENLDGISLE
jgi:hypothetical protein